MANIIVIFLIDEMKLSSNMDEISEHINSTNHKIHSYHQMGKMIVNLNKKKCENKNNSTEYLNQIINHY